MQELPFVVAKPDGDTKGLFGRDKDVEVKLLSIDKLRAQLDAIRSGFDELFAGMTFAGGYQLRTVEVGIEITAEGGIALIGSAKVGSKGAITLTFERS